MATANKASASAALCRFYAGTILLLLCGEHRAAVDAFAWPPPPPPPPSPGAGPNGGTSAIASASAPTEIQTPTTPLAASTPTRDAFDVFVEMRTGLGSGDGASDCVFWTAEGGTVFESPSGKVLAKFEGVDVCRGSYVRSNPDGDDEGSSSSPEEGGEVVVRQLSRKVFWFRDAVTGEIMSEYEGKPVRPIVYDAQAFEYRRGPPRPSVALNGEDDEDDLAAVSILSSVVGGPRIVPVEPFAGRWSSPSRTQMTFSIPIFIDMDVPGRGRYQASEFYDYTCDPSFPPDRPASAIWSRQGSIRPFVTNGKAVMHSVGRRATSLEELPASIRTVIEEQYPLFAQPPADMAEIDRLQKKAAMQQ